MDPYKAQRMNISQPVQQSKGGRAKNPTTRTGSRTQQQSSAKPDSRRRTVGNARRNTGSQSQTSGSYSCDTETTGKIAQSRGVTDKSKAKDFKRKRLKESLLSMEKAVGIRADASKGNAVQSDLAIDDFIRDYMSFIKSIPKAQKKKMIIDLQEGLTKFQIINNYVRYYRELRISFTGFEALREIIVVLRVFKHDLDDMEVTDISSTKSSRRKAKSEKIKHLNTLWTVLSVVDGVSTQARTTSYAYRFLRLFGVCLILGDYVTASVLADVLLEQLTFYEKLRRR